MTYGAKPSTVQAVPAGTGDAVPAAVKDEALPPSVLPSSTGTNEERAAWMSVLNLSEEQIQRTVIEHLDRRGVRDGNGRKVIYWHPKNGGIQQATAGQRINNARLGVRAGIPDVQLYYAGQLYCLELKALKGKLTPEQQSLGHLFREQGAITGCTYGLIEALAWLERYGLLEGKTI